MFGVLFLFLHRRSKLRADMPGSLKLEVRRVKWLNRETISLQTSLFKLLTSITNLLALRLAAVILCALCGKIKNKKATEFVFSVAFWVVYILLDKEQVNRIPPQPRQERAMPLSDRA